MPPSALCHARGPLSRDFPPGLSELSGPFASLLLSHCSKDSDSALRRPWGDGLSSLISLNTRKLHMEGESWCKNMKCLQVVTSWTDGLHSALFTVTYYKDPAQTREMSGGQIGRLQVSFLWATVTSIARWHQKPLSEPFQGDSW